MTTGIFVHNHHIIPEFSCKVFCRFILLLPANEVWGKVIFSQVCVKNSVHSGAVSQHALQVVSQHALQQVHPPGGCIPQHCSMVHPWDHTPLPGHPPGGFLVNGGWDQVCSRGPVFTPRGTAIIGTRSAPGGYTPGGDPPGAYCCNKRAVRILLECILISFCFCLLCFLRYCWGADA